MPPRRSAPVEQFGDALMIGQEDLAAARVAFRRRDGLVAGDRGQLADRRDRTGPVRLPVAIDDKARIGLQYRGRIERLRQTLGNPGDADVPGDVARELALRQAKGAQPAWDRPPGMVGGQKKSGSSGRPQHADRRRIIIAEQAVGWHESPLTVVTPAKAGVQSQRQSAWPLDSRLRGNDGWK